MTTINVWPQLGTTVTLESGYVVTAAGAAAELTSEIRGLLYTSCKLLDRDPTQENPNPSPIPPTEGGAGITAASVAELNAIVASSTGDVATLTATSGCGSFVWDASSSAIVDNALVCGGANPTGRWLRLRSDGAVNVQWFGALGNNNQDLFPTSYTSDVAITQQTADGIAINKAIVYLRSIGGGKLYIPKGTYRVWSNLESLNFNVEVVGDGKGQTILKSCDTAPTNAHGFGIFRTGEPSIFDYNATIKKISISKLTLDGNGHVRTRPTQEWRIDCLQLQAMAENILDDMECINGVRDCLCTSAESEGSSLGPTFQAAARLVSLKVTNCRFSDSFRNTVSLVGGDNNQFTNCDFLGGGYVREGTSPRACLDIECDGPFFTVRNNQFTNCRFQGAQNYLAAVIWSDAKFSGCRFIIEGGEDSVSPSENTENPWPFVQRDSRVDFEGCTFTNNQITGAAAFRSRFNCYPGGIYGDGTYAHTHRTSLRNCNFDGIGFYASGRHHVVMDNVIFRNSLYPFVIDAMDADDSSIDITNLKLINVGDSGNTFGGIFSAFIVRNTCQTKHMIVEGLKIIFDPAALPEVPGTATWKGNFGTGRAYGLYLYPDVASDATIRFTNVHVEGYWQKLPNYYGVTPSGTNFRDLVAVGSPADLNLPADSTSFTPGQIYYRGWTQYGDNP